MSKKQAKEYLSINAIQWLANGERGSSSDTLFTYLTGIDARQRAVDNYPYDVQDFRRCRLLLKQCPELKRNLDRVKEAGSVWNELVNQWDAICEAMDKDSCKAYRMIQKIREENE